MKGSCRVATACLISAVAGCSSAPIRYYTLTPPPGDISTSPKASAIIDVRIVHASPLLSRTELLVRTGPSEVALLDNERWVSPLKDEIKEALRLELQRRLGTLTELRPPAAKWTFELDVQHFEAEFGRQALVEASWSMVLAHGPGTVEARAVNCTFRTDERISAGYAAMIDGYQRGIAALAAAIIAELQRRASGIDGACGQMGGS